MNTSIYPNSSPHRATKQAIVEYFLSEWREEWGAKQLRDTTVSAIDAIRQKWVRNTRIFETMDGEIDAEKDIETFGNMLGKILSWQSISKEERRKMRIYIMRQVAYHTHDQIVKTPVLHPIMDYFQQEALRLVEKWIIPAFHDLDRQDTSVPNFHGIPGSVEHIHIPIKYGRLYGYIPSEWRNWNPSPYLYTDTWVLSEHWNPLFELDSKLHEWFNHTSSGYIGDDLFLVFHDPWNYGHTWRIRDKNGETIETFKSRVVQNLWYNVLCPSDDRGDTGLGLYNFKKKKWILQWSYHLHMTHEKSENIVLQSKESSKHGLYNLREESWSIPCEKNKLIPIQWLKSLKNTTYLAQDDTWNMIILNHLWVQIQQFSIDTTKQIGFMSEYSDSEKFRYFIGFSKNGNPYFAEEFYILSSTWDISVWPFQSTAWDKSGQRIFMKDKNSDEYTHIDMETWEIREIKIPGELLLTREKHYVHYVIFEENGKFGIKDLNGEVVVVPQEHKIVSYLPSSWNLLLSKKTPTEEFPLTHERCPEEYQYITQNGKVVIPWSRELSGMEYVDDSTQFSCYAGKLIYTGLSWKPVIRDVPGVTLTPTSEQWIYIVEEDLDRWGLRFSLYNAKENMIYVQGRWIKLEKWDDSLFFSGSSSLEKLDNGNFILGTTVVTPKGEQLVPYGSESIIPYRDNTGKEVWVICRYRNALMKITWHAPVEIEKEW